MPQITLEQLKEAHVCGKQRELFAHLTEVTGEVAMPIADEFSYDFSWATNRLLSEPAKKAYGEMVSPAKKAHAEARNAAQKAYDEARAVAFVTCYINQEKE